MYNQIEYLDDAVLFCLLKTRRWNVIAPKIEVTSSSFNERPKYSVNLLERYVQIKAINELQKSRFSGANFRNIERDFRYNKRSDYLAEFFDELKDICERYEYKNSNLYHNVMDIVDGTF